MKNRINLLLLLAIAALCIPAFTLSGFNQDEGEYVGASTCVGCHDDMEKMAKTIHGRLGEHEMAAEDSCEACHGNGEEHAMSDGEEPIPYSFGEDTVENDVNARCVTCHVGGETLGWHMSEHSASGLTCLDCHDVKAEYRMMTLSEKTAQCTTCHADQKAKFNMPSRHPLIDEQMGCTDCHNPHGDEETMLRAETVNGLCLDCHADKHGPFMYEHEPVVEDCLICHEAKGAMHNNLLKANETSLCLRCHAGHEDVHPNLSSSRAGYMTKCTRCHSQIHGSDLPGFSGPSRFIR